MANELQHLDAETGSTLYFVRRKATGEMWNTFSAAWEARTVANWYNAGGNTYRIAMSENPAGGYVYVGSLPAIAGNMAAHWGWCEVYKQAGADPAISDTIRGRYFGYWDGATFRFWGSDATHVNGTLQTAGDLAAILDAIKGAGWTTETLKAIKDQLVTVADDVAGLDGEAMRGTDGANTVEPDPAGTGTTIIAALEIIPLDAAETQAAAAAAITAAGVYTGTPPTADAIGTDAASKILVTPANKLATNASGQVTPTAESKTGYSLAATGLDAIADPDDLTPATVPTTFSQKLRWLIQRFWKADKSATAITVKNEAGQTITSQTITPSGSDQTTGAPS